MVMNSVKVAIGRGIYEIPVSDEKMADYVKKTCSFINTKVNTIISEGNLKNEKNDFIMLLAFIEIMQSIENENHQIANHENSDNAINQSQESIKKQIDSAVIGHFKSLIEKLQNISNS